MSSAGASVDVDVFYVTMDTFDVVNHLFVVVCGCGPHDEPRPSYLHVLCASGGGGACLRVWSCPLVAKCYL